MFDDGVIGGRADGDRLLDQAGKELPSMLRGPPIESKGAFIQVGVEVLTLTAP